MHIHSGTGDAAPTLGSRLKEWRARRGASQMALAAAAETTQRHVSFLESGRARPSRAMIVRIGEALDIPLRGRNELLALAGFAALYMESPLEQATLERAREALQRILAHHEPYPAMVLDRSWNIVLTNSASTRILSACLISNGAIARPEGVNFMRAMFDPNGLKPCVRNWGRTAAILLARLRREVHASPGSPSERLLQELLPAAVDVNAVIPECHDLEPTAPLELQIGRDLIRLFNTLTVFGTPQDVTLQELRIEMSFPMDDQSEAFLRSGQLALD